MKQRLDWRPQDSRAALLLPHMATLSLCPLPHLCVTDCSSVFAPFSLLLEAPADSCVLVQLTCLVGTALLSASALPPDALLSSLGGRCVPSPEPIPSRPWTPWELGPWKPAAQLFLSVAGNITLISWLQDLSL